MSVKILQQRTTIRNEGTEKPNVTGYIKTKKTGFIVAEGSGLTFEEYGTGTIGRNSNYPKDKIPTGGIPITGGWVYNYPSKYKRISRIVEIYFGFIKSLMGMLFQQKVSQQECKCINTSRELNKQKKNIVSSIIDNINKGQK